jgi:hypothetical protein
MVCHGRSRSEWNIQHQFALQEAVPLIADSRVVLPAAG